jgi:GNAT superfamily N-acetyltransferase
MNTSLSRATVSYMTPGLGTVVRVTPGVHWHALEDDVVVGRGHALHRPDGRVFVSADTWRDDVFETLATTMAADLGGPVYTVVAEDDIEHLGRWSALGFVDHRYEDEYLIPTDPAATGLAGARLPPGYTLRTADQVPEDDLRALDERLRQDVPGTAGWVNDPAEFREATYGPRFYDPSSYLVARHGTDDVGLVRVWRGRVPRLGLVAVVPGHRNRGLARAMLATVFATLLERGVTSVCAEADRTNTASQTLLASLGAKRTGGVVELVRRGDRPG